MKFDKAYYDALNRAFDKECELADHTVPTEITPSPQFTKNMERMLRRQRRPYFRWISAVMQNAACIVGIVLIVGFVGAMQVDAVRVPFCKFLVDTVGGTISIDDSANAPEIIDRYYEITQFPSGFEPELQSSTLFMESTLYYYINKNDNAETLLFGQCLLKDYKDVKYEGEAEYVTDTDGTEYLVMHTANGTSVIWNDGEYAFFLISDREMDEALTVCRSLQEKIF